MRFRFRFKAIYLNSCWLCDSASCNLTSSLFLLCSSCSASSLLIAKANCNCSSSSPTVCGRALSISLLVRSWLADLSCEIVQLPWYCKRGKIISKPIAEHFHAWTKHRDHTIRCTTSSISYFLHTPLKILFYSITPLHTFVQQICDSNTGNNNI